jgi:hypothetical protein
MAGLPHPCFDLEITSRNVKDAVSIAEVPPLPGDLYVAIEKIASELYEVPRGRFRVDREKPVPFLVRES